MISTIIHLFFPVGLVLMLVLGLTWLNFILRIEAYLGVIPRNFGVMTISRWFLSWGVHADKMHLFQNLMAFIPLLCIYFVFLQQELSLFFYIVLAQSVATWLIGSSKYYYIGASGVIYALFGYIVAYLWQDHSTNIQLLAAVLVVLTMGINMFYGLIKVEKNVSSLSHLLGLLSGVFVQYLNQNPMK